MARGVERAPAGEVVAAQLGDDILHRTGRCPVEHHGAISYVASKMSGLALLPLEVTKRSPESLRVIAEEPEALVARVAQDAANALGDVAVVDSQPLGAATDCALAFPHEPLELVQRNAIGRLGLVGSHTLPVGRNPLTVLGLLTLLVSRVVRRALGARADLAPPCALANSVVVLTGLHLPALRTPNQFAHRR